MKKIIKIFTAAAILLCGFALTGCGAKEIVTETIKDSYKEWYKYKGKDVPVPIGASDNATTDAETSRLQNAELFVYFDPDVGLKVAVQSTSEEDVQLAHGLVSTSVELVTGGTQDYPVSQFGKGKWAALWASGKFKECDAPKVVTEPERCVIITGENSNGFKIQWKKLLANYLINWSEQ